MAWNNHQYPAQHQQPWAPQTAPYTPTAATPYSASPTSFQPALPEAAGQAPYNQPPSNQAMGATTSGMYRPSSHQSDRTSPSRSVSFPTTASPHFGIFPPFASGPHACITLNTTDRLRLIKLPPEMNDNMRNTIQQCWPKGIQSERNYAGSYEFKLAGNPWAGQGSEAVPSRQLMSGIFSCMYHHGWVLVASTDVSKKTLDKDTLIFRKGHIPSPCTFLAISFNEGDKLRLIGNLPPEVINSFKRVLGGRVQREDWKVQPVAYQFKLYGNPWWASGDEAVSMRVMLLSILDALTTLGWEFHASIDMSTGSQSLDRSSGNDTDTWFMRKPST